MAELPDKFHSKILKEIVEAHIDNNFPVIQSQKTFWIKQIATRLAYDFKKQDNNNVIWLRSSNEQEILKDLSKLYRSYMKNKVHCHINKCLSTIVNYFNGYPTLFIFENADPHNQIMLKILRYISKHSSKIKTIVTSNFQDNWNDDFQVLILDNIIGDYFELMKKREEEGYDRYLEMLNKTSSLDELTDIAKYTKL